MAVNPEITHADLFRMLGQAVAEAEAWKQHAARLAQELQHVADARGFAAGEDEDQDLRVGGTD